MSVKVSSWVWHDDATAEINGNEMILLLALADVADDNGRCRYLPEDDSLTYDALSRKVRVDRRTIERLIPKLRSRGLLAQTKGAKGRPNEFEIRVPWARRSADNLSGNVTDSPTGGQDSPTPEATFADNGGVRPSYRRTDVRDVSTSDVASDALPAKYPAEVYHLCNVLADAVKANGHKVGVVGVTWWAACERLMRLDGYSVEQIDWMIRWATSDEFWSANIRSMPTLREKFSTLVAQAKRRRRATPDERFQESADRGARLQALVEQQGLAS